MKRTMINFVKRWGPALVLMLTIFVASDTPSDRIPELQRGDDLLKKGGHALGYGMLALGFLRGLGGQKKHARWLAFLMAVGYALTDEFHQTSTPGRTPSFWDVGIDSAGAVLALLLHRRLKIFQRLTCWGLPRDSQS